MDVFAKHGILFSKHEFICQAWNFYFRACIYLPSTEFLFQSMDLFAKHGILISKHVFICQARIYLPSTQFLFQSTEFFVKNGFQNPIVKTFSYMNSQLIIQRSWCSIYGFYFKTYAHDCTPKKKHVHSGWCKLMPFLNGIGMHWPFAWLWVIKHKYTQRDKH